MRRFLLLILVCALTACGGDSGGQTQPTPNLRQQTATAVAARAASSAQRTATPTAKLDASTARPTNTPTATPTLAPITVTPLPSPTGQATVPPAVTPSEATATAEATATPEPSATPEPPSATGGRILFNRGGALWAYDVGAGEAVEILPDA